MNPPVEVILNQLYSETVPLSSCLRSELAEAEIWIHSAHQYFIYFLAMTTPKGWAVSIFRHL